VAAGAVTLAGAGAMNLLRESAAPQAVTTTGLLLAAVVVYCATRAAPRVGAAFVAATLAITWLSRAASLRAAEVPLHEWPSGLVEAPGRLLAAGLAVPLLAFALARAVTARLADRQRREALAAREADVEARSAVAGERARIARELHDVVAHHVSLVAVRAETAPYTAADLSPPARAAFAEIADSSRTALEELRMILRVLRREDGLGPELAPQPGLDDLGDLVDQGRSAGMDLRYEPLPEGVPVPAPQGLTAYKVVQEGLSNVRRHAPRSPVQVRLAVESGLLEVLVENGPEATARGPSGSAPGGHAGRRGGTPAGFGLVGMRERVQSMAGELRAGPTADGGWRVLAHLPLRPDPGEAAS
jgi:signal transduction histidine kinase